MKYNALLYCNSDTFFTEECGSYFICLSMSVRQPILKDLGGNFSEIVNCSEKIAIEMCTSMHMLGFA